MDLFNIKIKESELYKGLGEDEIYLILQSYFQSTGRNDVNVYLVGGTSNDTWSLKQQLINGGITTSVKRFEVFDVPVMSGRHSTIVVVDNDKMQINHMDSYGADLPTLRKAELLDLFPGYLIKTLAAYHVVQQTDGWSCGIHSIINGIDLVEGTIDLTTGAGLAATVNRNIMQVLENFVISIEKIAPKALGVVDTFMHHD